MVVQVEPVVHDGEHWVRVIIGGIAVTPRGPFGTAGEAELAAERMRQVGRALTSSSEGRHG